MSKSLGPVQVCLGPVWVRHSKYPLFIIMFIKPVLPRDWKHSAQTQWDHFLFHTLDLENLSAIKRLFPVPPGTPTTQYSLSSFPVNQTPCLLLLAGAATSINFAATNTSFVTTKVCLLRQNISSNKIMFVVTNILVTTSMCLEENMFVATSILLSRQKTCFVATNTHLSWHFFYLKKEKEGAVLGKSDFMDSEARL